jgi:LmbE family N-acetylglucosaminyl deacetylase
LFLSNVKYKNIYLSPHYDDAALSCGGTIHRYGRAGEPVLVITIFAAPPPPDAPLSPLASELHARMGGAEELNRVRRAEDRAAMAVLGADSLRLPFPDCIYRGPSDHEWYYRDMREVFGDIHPAEAALAGTIADSIALRLSGARDVTIHAPLGVGRHVDHQITNQVGWALSRQGWTVFFYEDFPYSEPGYGQAGAGPEEHDPIGQTLAEQPVVLRPLDSEISNDDLDARIRSIQAYGSQLALVFGDPTTLAERVAAQTLRHGGDRPIERSWTRTRPAG